MPAWKPDKNRQKLRLRDRRQQNQLTQPENKTRNLEPEPWVREQQQDQITHGASLCWRAPCSRGKRTSMHITEIKLGSRKTHERQAREPDWQGRILRRTSNRKRGELQISGVKQAANRGQATELPANRRPRTRTESWGPKSKQKGKNFERWAGKRSPWPRATAPREKSDRGARTGNLKSWALSRKLKTENGKQKNLAVLNQDLERDRAGSSRTNGDTQTKQSGGRSFRTRTDRKKTEAAGNISTRKNQRGQQRIETECSSNAWSKSKDQHAICTGKIVKGTTLEWFAGEQGSLPTERRQRARTGTEKNLSGKSEDRKTQNEQLARAKTETGRRQPRYEGPAVEKQDRNGAENPKTETAQTHNKMGIKPTNKNQNFDL
jgi:hypothetical protein